MSQRTTPAVAENSVSPATDLRRDGQKALDWIAEYLERAESLPVLSQVKPGEIYRSLPKSAPQKPESFDAILKDLEARFPQDTTVNVSYLPALRGLIALKQGKLAEALTGLEPALANEFALPATAFLAGFGSLYSAYVRGLTFTAARKPAEAAIEFEKIISHRGLVAEDPVDALARLQRARALSASGDLPGARAGYEDFLTLWKQADTDLPLLKQAQIEAAKLR